MTYNVTDLGVHHFCNDNKLGVQESQRCGCFCCCRIFPARDVTEYVGTAPRAVCPLCGIDSVLPGAWIELTTELLVEMEQKWFSLRKED